MQQCDGDRLKMEFVELGGIEPPSNAEFPGILRAQSDSSFYSAPTFATDF